MEVNSIAILGCGWLGFPLAIKLLDKNYLIKGSTTSVEKLPVLKEHCIAPYLVRLDPEKFTDDLTDFLNVDLLIINVPPGRNKDVPDDYGLKMKQLADKVTKSTVKKLIFISSTSVYPEINRIVDEEQLDLAKSAPALRMLAAEEIFNGLENIETTVIRMAGLIGPNRHPGRFFAAKENIPDGLNPVNLIHLDDCIGMICHVIENGLWKQTYNGVAPTHPSKTDFYDLASLKLYGKNALFLNEKGDFKVVDAKKIIKTGYHFKHPDLMEWLSQTPQS
ncbi:hypothetical protein I5M32_12395 [Pedobacter sp. SD-b]|uniref:Nucleoside-diphosphate-sugar epimerase n=1 Tax=Pedobacter segetis TaxID=2793069 RepID=A0ABS1BLJ1_9SPHI|nr:hypothetical protein [Pedobacter segetis]MBK0383760.1 hypothetical protein [Pedobacter segetis]